MGRPPGKRNRPEEENFGIKLCITGDLHHLEAWTLHDSVQTHRTGWAEGGRQDRSPGSPDAQKEACHAPRSFGRPLAGAAPGRAIGGIRPAIAALRPFRPTPNSTPNSTANPRTRCPTGPPTTDGKPTGGCRISDIPARLTPPPPRAVRFAPPEPDAGPERERERSAPGPSPEEGRRRAIPTATPPDARPGSAPTRRASAGRPRPAPPAGWGPARSASG